MGFVSAWRGVRSGSDLGERLASEQSRHYDCGVINRVGLGAGYPSQLKKYF